MADLFSSPCLKTATASAANRIAALDSLSRIALAARPAASGLLDFLHVSPSQKTLSRCKLWIGRGEYGFAAIKFRLNNRKKTRRGHRQRSMPGRIGDELSAETGAQLQKGQL